MAALWILAQAVFIRSAPAFKQCSDNLILFQTTFALRCRPVKARASSPCCFEKLFHGRSTLLRQDRAVRGFGKTSGRNSESEATS